MEVALISAAVVAVTEFLKRINLRDYSSALHIAVAALVGVGAGLLGLQGLDMTTGLLAGLASAGVITTAKKIGN